MAFDVIHATCKGNAENHIYQDYIKFVDGDSCLMAIVADGLGSASKSSVGSELICRLISKWADSIDWNVHNIREVLNTSVIEWYRILEYKGVEAKLCCTTCSVVAVNKLAKHAYLCQIGDSPIFFRKDNEKTQLIDFEKDFLNETECIGTTKKPTFNVSEVDYEDSFDFLVATDGFGDDVNLEMSDQLFDYFITKYRKIRLKKRNVILKKELISAMVDKNNDDKSLIFGWTSR